MVTPDVDAGMVEGEAETKCDSGECMATIWLAVAREPAARMVADTAEVEGGKAPGVIERAGISPTMRGSTRQERNAIERDEGAGEETRSEAAR